MTRSIFTVSYIKRDRYQKDIHIKNKYEKKVLTVPLSTCVNKGDRIDVSKRRVLIKCKNGEINIDKPYKKKEIINIGNKKIPILIKEITETNEYELAQHLSDYHYRGHSIYGRTARIIIKASNNRFPKVLGYIELASPFYMNKPRSEILNDNFSNSVVSWETWNADTVKKYLNVIVRISRTVVSPEFRGIGLGQLLVNHAINFAKLKWQMAGYKPYFLEISADMLKYVPFAEKAGMIYVGDTEGNLDRVEKDMKYLIERFKDKDLKTRKKFEKTCGICDQQIARMSNALKIIEREGINQNELLKRLGNLTKKKVLKEFALFNGIVSLPKPHYMIGLDKHAHEFIEERKQKIGFNDLNKKKIKISIKPISENIRLDVKNMTYISKVRRTISTHAIQQAFGISPDNIITTIIKNLYIEIFPGEILLIVGPSGSGKTSLLSLFNKKKNNNISLDGNIELPKNAKLGKFIKIRSKKSLIEIVSDNSDIDYGLYILGLAGLSEAFLYLKRFEELSAGQQYRAMLAKMLTSNSNIWIADEFCTNLDTVTANIVSEKIRKTAKEIQATLILAAPHCSNFIFSLKPDRVMVLSNTNEYKILTGEEYIKYYENGK